MRCNACGFDNPQRMRFCGQCAAPLPERCPKCGTENPAGFRFCGGCSAPLAEPAAERTISAIEPTLSAQTIPEHTGFDVSEGERKTVTALFADIKGSTELMEYLDPEEARAIVDPALTLMIDAAHHYDGYVVQSTGDGIFALFGAPVAREDHPQRALYAAFRLQEELKRNSDGLLAHLGHFTLLAEASESCVLAAVVSRRIRGGPMTWRTLHCVAAKGIEFPVHPHILRHRGAASLKSENTMRIRRFHLSNIIVRITTLAKFCPL